MAVVWGMGRGAGGVSQIVAHEAGERAAAVERLDAELKRMSVCMRAPRFPRAGPHACTQGKERFRMLFPK